MEDIAAKGGHSPLGRRSSTCWIVLQLLLAAVAVPVVHALPPLYMPWQHNNTCRYEATNISSGVFFGNTSTHIPIWNPMGSPPDFLFPLETAKAVYQYASPWQACYGPEETPDLAEIAEGTRLPCSWSVNRWGNIDYQEEHACEVLLKSNCYCYSVGRDVGSYCEPGLGGTGRSLSLPVTDCEASTAGIIADGARRVSRATVYNTVPNGHFIALAVKPADGNDDTGDFHFWRLDVNGAWSYKAGDTLVRNTYRNGSLVRDIEAPISRGAYTNFCGFFEVNRLTHRLAGTGYFFSNIPTRYQLWRRARLQSRITRLPIMSEMWHAAYSDYFRDAGWEDPPQPARFNDVVWPRLERAAAAGARKDSLRGAGGHKHWYSVTPRSFREAGRVGGRRKLRAQQLRHSVHTRR